MPEENLNQTEEPEETPPPEESDAPAPPKKRRFFTRRKVLIALGVLAVIAVILTMTVTVSYRYGVFDTYIKTQFVNALGDMNITFDADTFRVTVAPLQLELKNATFNDKITGERLFRIGEARLEMSVEDLYALQLERNIDVQSTELRDVEAWVKFDEEGNSNFSNIKLIEPENRIKFNYASTRFTLRNGIIHFGEATREIAGDAKNVELTFEPVNYEVPESELRYKFDFTSTESNFVYDESKVEPIDIRAEGIANRQGAEITSLKLTSPIGESNLSGTIQNWQLPKYDLKIDSTVDLTQTSDIFPLGTAIRGVGNFSGKVTGEGEKYRVEGEITSDALAASNIYLRALNVNATVEGTNTMYDANGKAIAELLTFEDFKIDFPQLVGNIRGTGTDFRWVGELQAAAAKSPMGTLGGLFITDAVAEYKDKQLDATLGNVRADNFFSPEAEAENIRASNVKVTSANGTTDVALPNVQASSVKTDDATLRGVTANNAKFKNRDNRNDLTVDNLRAENLETKDARLRNLSTNGVTLQNQKGSTQISAKNAQADSLDTQGAKVGNLTASNVDIKIAGNETLVYSDNLRIARVETDAAVLGTLNIAGVRMTIREGRVEARTNDIDAGNIDLRDQGNLENVKLVQPVFILEPSGRYRASMDMSLGGGVLGSVTLGAASSSVVATNDQIELNNLTARVLEGNLDGEAVIALNDRRRSEVSAEFSGLDLSKLLALQGGRVVPLEGKTSGNVNFTFPGTNFKAASGNLVADITANAGTGEQGLIPLTGRIETVATDGLFDLDYARLNTAKSEFNATGSFDLNGQRSNLELALNSTDASEIRRLISVLNISPELEEQLNSVNAEFAGNLAFTGNLTGNVSNPTIDGRASLDSIILRGNNLGSLSSDIFVSPDVTELRNGRLQEPDGGTLAFNVTIPGVGTNNISVEATLDKVNTGNILAALPVELPVTLRNLQADTSGTVNLSGLPKNMQGEANLTAVNGTIEGQTFDNLETRLTFAGTLVTLENFEAAFGTGFLKASGTYLTDTTAFNLNIESKDVELTRIRPFIPNNESLPQITGKVDLTARAVGIGSDSTTYDINFNGLGRNVAVYENGVGNVTFAGTTENQLFKADLTATFEGTPQVISATVNFADPDLPLHVETVFNNTPLAPFIAIFRPPTNVSLSGTATGRVVFDGNLSALSADGQRQWTTENLSGTAQFSSFSLQFEETMLSAVEPISIRFNSREVVVENAQFAGGGSNLIVSGTKALTANGINNLTVDGKIDLRLLNVISRNTFFTGVADISMRLTGENRVSRLVGSAQVINSSVSTFVGSERLTFDRVNGRLIFTSNQAQIEEASAFLGGGKVTASGGALIEGLSLQRLRLEIRGNNITAPLPKDFLTTGDAQIEVNSEKLGNSYNTTISGVIYAKRSLFTKDIDLADIISGRREGSLSQGTSSPSVIGVPKLNLRIEGRDALVVRNNIADLTASASLWVTGDVDFPQVSGRITANSGTVFFRNDRYEVQRGVLEFPPGADIEPIINLQAESEIKGYQIVVNLSGNLTNTESLVATVRSNPALPQPDVISLITTGNLANTDNGIPTLAQSGINTAAEILTDAIINEPIRKATDKLFGLNRFEIDPIISAQRLNPSARLTVGRQINNNLLITYSTNLSEDQNQVLAFEYRVSNRLSFVAQYEQRSLSNVTRNRDNFSFEIRLRKRF